MKKQFYLTLLLFVTLSIWAAGSAATTQASSS